MTSVPPITSLVHAMMTEKKEKEPGDDSQLRAVRSNEAVRAETSGIRKMGILMRQKMTFWAVIVHENRQSGKEAPKLLNAGRCAENVRAKRQVTEVRQWVIAGDYGMLPMGCQPERMLCLQSLSL